MKRGKSGSIARRVLNVLLVVVAVTMFGHLLLQHLNLNVFDEKQVYVYELSNRLDLDDESSIPTWIAQAMLLSVAVLAFFTAYLEKRRASKTVWLIIGLVGLVFSLDEIASLHELILQVIHILALGFVPPTIVANAWLIVLPFVLAFGLWLLRLMTKTLPQRTIRLFMVAGGLFVVGAAGVDILTSTTDASLFFVQGILVFIEEGMELIATAIAIYAIVDYLEQTHGAVIGRAHRQLHSHK